jgi:arsenate reductase (thioredoxin)
MTPEQRAEKKRVLIFWTGNSAASQMAEGLLRHDAGEYFEVESAGTRPDAVRPEAIAVLHEVGIDISGHRSKHIDELGGLHFDFIISVDDNAREACPIFFEHGQKLHCDFADPGAFAGPDEQRLDLFRRVRDELRGYLREFALIVTSAEPGIDE